MIWATQLWRVSSILFADCEVLSLTWRLRVACFAQPIVLRLKSGAEAYYLAFWSERAWVHPRRMVRQLLERTSGSSLLKPSWRALLEVSCREDRYRH